jgi:hypothetical protein
VAIQKRRIDRIGFEPRDERRGFPVTAAHCLMVLQQNLGVILLTAAQRAANGVEPE